MTYSIRPAGEADWPFISELFDKPHVAPMLHSPTESEYFRSLVSRSYNAVVERDGSPFGNMVLDLDPSWLANLRAIAMLEPRCGAGRFAIEHAIRYAFDDLGAHRIFLEVLESNAPCRHLVEGAGFRVEGLYRDGYRDDSGTYHNLVPYGMLRSDSRIIVPPNT